MANSEEAPAWTPVDTPFEVDLFDVAGTNDGPYAVGESGTVAANWGEGWRVVIDAGPAAKDRRLHAIDVTDDGKRVWFVGASGVIGAYDIPNGRKYDFSHAEKSTSTWESVAVGGKAGSETVLVGSGSGTIVAGGVSGVKVSRTNETTPGPGASISAIEFAPGGTAYAVDTSGNVFRSNGARGWENIGIVNASAAFNDVHAGANGPVLVAANDGSLYRYDGESRAWKRSEVTTTALVSVDGTADRTVVLSANSTFYSRPVGGESGWTRRTGPTGNDLLALALGQPDVAVGKAGAVVRRRTPQNPERTERAKKRTEPRPTVTCQDLVDELLGRLSREELVQLIESRAECDPPILEHLKDS